MSKKEASEVINIVVKGERRIFNLINRISTSVQENGKV
jgi:hypothetical protein